MQALLVVHFPQKLTDRGAGVLQITIFATVDFLIFQGLDKRLAGCVIPGVALARYADLDAQVLQELGVISAGTDAERWRSLPAPVPLPPSETPSSSRRTAASLNSRVNCLRDNPMIHSLR
jgi:hypothetical protein